MAVFAVKQLREAVKGRADARRRGSDALRLDRLVRNKVALPINSSVRGSLRAFPRWSARRSSLDTYGQRDCVEKCFMAGKTDLNMDVLRAHSRQMMNGRFIVSFAALTLLSEIRRRMAAPESVVVKDGRKKSLADEYTRTSLMSHIASVKVICDGDECRFAEVTKRQHEIATRMDCPDLYAVVPSFFSTPS